VKQDKKAHVMLEKKLREMKEQHEREAITAFMLDLDEGLRRDGAVSFLKRAGFWDFIIETYQHRLGRRFTRTR